MNNNMNNGDSGGDGKLNYALIASMLGFAAVGFIKSNLFQIKIKDTKIKIQHQVLHSQNQKPEEKKVEHRLMERQWDYCSLLVRNAKLVELEKDLLVYTAKQSLLAGLEVEDGLRDIFKNDRTCAELRNTDKRKNGSLMWLYLKYWRLQLALQTHQKAEAAILNTQNKK
ncbi:hypothetical protein M9458_038857 [Cirrhinus mrigala]|uniref:Uncharacterized protein n=1 Tax=Cirrhinus mrigala TaxID=683832 RepID=A0ABD0P2D2_CIRMR